MAEYKQYITQIQENGNVMISEDVIATIVANALAEVDGIGSMGTKPGITLADFTIKKNWSKSLKIAIAEDNTVTYAARIINIPDHGANVPLTAYAYYVLEGGIVVELPANADSISYDAYMATISE
jgi:uncharacterized alkaline shock family protein YloU